MSELDYKAMADRAHAIDQTGEWPADDLAALADAGAMRWAIARPFGDERPSLDLHLKYESIAAASLAAALVFSQRDSAVQLIGGSESFAGRDEMLRQFAANDRYATIGIAQLTTSRQGGAPALRATPTADGFVLDGIIPWSTGAAKADWIVAGAVLPDMRQILFCLPTNLAGVVIDPPLQLVALRATWTSLVHCNHVTLHRSLLLCGPAERVLAGGKKGVPFGQVFLALGLCRAAIDLIAEHHSDAGNRSRASFENELHLLRNRVLWLSGPGMGEAPGAGPITRADVNDLAIRATHAAVALYKGTSLLADHPAQRLAREAMFLLVWSCPGAVIDCTLDRLLEC